MSKKRIIDKQFKIDAVNYKDNHPELTLEQVATILGVSLSSIHRWIKSYSSNNGDHDNAFRGTNNYSSNDAKELARLKKENRDLKDAVEILKKAMNILNSQYINMSEQEIQAMDNPAVYKTRDKPTNNYVNIIYKMYIDGIKPEIIFSYVCRLGFSGSWSTLDHQIKRILKNNFRIILPMNWYLKYEYPPEITVIKRNEVLKYITTKDEKKKRSKKVESVIEIIRERYLVIKELEEVYNCFYSTLMGDDPNQLYVFIEEYRSSKLSGFIKGIEKDIAPIKNAISFPYSSGFVEGNNNKFKLIKRILYGRSNLFNLFRKCYVPFLMNNIDFNLSDLLKR